MGLLIFAWIFRISWPKMGVLGAKQGRSGAMLTLNELVFPFRGSCVFANFGENRSRVRTDGYTDTLGERAFSYVGPAAWNSLPTDLRVI